MPLAKRPGTLVKNTKSEGGGDTIQPIELLVFIPITLIAIFFLSALFKKKINATIGLGGIILGLTITLIAGPYYWFAIIPIRNWAWYGAPFTWLTGVSIYHVSSLWFMAFVAGYNLYFTMGYTLWTFVLPPGGMGSIRRVAQDMARSRRQMRRDQGGLIGAVIGGGMILATILGGWGIYNFFQNPDVTYNIDSPIGGTSAWLPVSGSGLGINTDLIIIVGAAILIIFLMFRASAGDDDD